MDHDYPKLDLSPEQLAAIDTHLVDVYLRLASPCPGVRQERRPDSTVVLSEFGHPMGNFAVGLRYSDVDAADEGIGELLGRFRGANRAPRVYLTGQETPANLGAALRRRGLYEAFTLDQMVLVDPGRIDAECQNGCETVTSVEEATAVGEFGAREFFPQLPRDVRKGLAEVMSAATWQIVSESDGEAVYVKRGSEVVASGLACVNGTVGGIYNVATTQKARGCGLATSITCCLVNRAIRSGCRLVVLQATDAGKQLYARLGFRRFGELRCYVS